MVVMSVPLFVCSAKSLGRWVCLSMFGREERVSAGVPVGIVDTDGGGVVESVVEGRVSCRHSCRQDRAERRVCRPVGRVVLSVMTKWPAVSRAGWSAECPVFVFD